MKLIRDLGMLFPTEKSKQKKRFGIYECPKCKSECKTETKKNMASACVPCYRKSTKYVKHGDSKKRLNNIYFGIKDRCTNVNNPNYFRYGGRGIDIADEWLDYKAFKTWSINNGYSDDLTIDRIDNDKGYYPYNCRWVPMTVQARNTKTIRSTNKTGYRGVSLSSNKKNKFTATIVVNQKNIYLGRYKTEIEAAIVYNNYIIKNNLEHTLNEI